MGTIPGAIRDAVPIPCRPSLGLDQRAARSSADPLSHGAEKVHRLRDLIFQAVDADTVLEALATLYDIGVSERNPGALTVWLAYAIGKPREGGMRAEVLERSCAASASKNELLTMSDEDLHKMLHNLTTSRGSVEHEPIPPRPDKHPGGRPPGKTGPIGKKRTMLPISGPPTPGCE